MVYLAALETGRYNAATIVLDEPIEVKLGARQGLAPQNFTPEIHGPVPLMRALADSLNLATVHVGLDVGVKRIADTFARLGLEQDCRPESVAAFSVGWTSRRSKSRRSSTASRTAVSARRLRAVRVVIGADGSPSRHFHSR